MKLVKKISIVLTLFSLVFFSCEKEEISYAFQEISAPTQVTAKFDIAQDDSGLVTITPSARGAQSFQVYFGDVDNEEPELVTPGGSLEHVYGEGQFRVRIIGVGSTGLTSEYTQVLNISFSAPENLEVTIDQSDPNPFLIRVSATADNASMFDVYFGDVADEEPSQLMPGETIEHIYAETGEYTVRVVAIGAGSATQEYEETITISGASGEMALPITFDDPSVNYAFSTFNGSSFEVVDNPDQSGSNAKETKVGALTNSGVNWEGTAATLGTPIDFGGDNKTITMNVWASTPVPVLFKVENGVDGERECEVVANHGGTGWELLSFNFATDATKSFIDGSQGVGEPFVPTGKYATMVIFIDGPGTTAGTFYLDDIDQPAAANCDAEMEENIDPALGDINWTFMTADFAHSFEPFGNIQSEIVANPNTSGINTSCNVQNYIKTAGCETWSGVGKGLANAIDLTATSSTQFSLMVYGETKATEVTLRLEFEPFPNTEPSADVVQTMTKVGEWEELIFDFSAHTDKTFKSIIVYFDRDQPCDDAVYYFDNLKQMEGMGAGPTDPEMAAPMPDVDPAQVISVYSDAYDDLAGTDFYPNWGQSTTFEEVDLMGDKAIKYGNANYQGIQLGSAVDLGEYAYVHIDVWSNDYASIPFYLISESTGENSVDLMLEAGQWNSIDVPLTAFTDQGLGISDIFQFKFDVQPNDGGTFYIDNLYFVREESSSAVLELPITFDDASLTYEFTTFNGASYEVVDNPDASGANPAVSKVGAITNSGNNWEGGYFILDNPVDFSGSNKTISILFWSDVSVPVLLKFEGGVNGERENEVVLTHGGTGWEVLEFDFANDATKSFIDGSQGVGEPFVPTGQYKNLVLFVDGPGNTAGTFYMDELTQK